MAKERTFIAIKPDGVQRGLIHDIIRRFEQRGIQLVAMKMIKPTKELAEQHYAEHAKAAFFPKVIAFMTSGPIIAMVWEGEDVISKSRKLIGATDPCDAEIGTIRGDLCLHKGRNMVHGSDSRESAEREIGIWFQPSELCSWTPSNTPWIYE